MTSLYIDGWVKPQLTVCSFHNKLKTNLRYLDHHVNC